MNYDIAIIGGGPAGYTAAERAAEGGLKTVLFEKNAIGGVCLNEGCIPTKTLLYSAKILDSFKTSFKYGISPEGTPSFDMDKIISGRTGTVKKLTSGVKMRLTSSGITIVEGTAVLNGETDGMIRIQCGNALFTVKNVLLCTGSETVIPPIKGLSDTDYWTSREALDSKEHSQRTCHHRRRCHRDRVCFILYQHGSKSKGDRDDAGNTRRDGQRGFRHAPERIRQERGWNFI